MKKKNMISLNNVHVAIQSLYSFDPMFDMVMLDSYKIVIIEDTGNFLEVNGVKIVKYYKDVENNEFIPLVLNTKAYKNKVEYTVGDYKVDHIISVKELIDDYFDSVITSDYENYYYNDFLYYFKDKEFVEKELIYEFDDEIRSLYDSYFGYILDEIERINNKDKVSDDIPSFRHYDKTNNHDNFKVLRNDNNKKR